MITPNNPVWTYTLFTGHLPELRRAVILTEKDVVKRRE